MSYLGLLPPILSVIRKMYCTCLNSNIGQLTEEVIPSDYKKLLSITQKDNVWINKVLRGMHVMSEGNEVVEAIVTPYGPSPGYFSELAYLKVKYKYENDPKNPPTDTIVKFLPIGFDKRLVLDLISLPKTECLMYYHFLRDHEKHGLPPPPFKSPKILYADFCSKTNSALLIMERIDVTLGDQRNPASLSQARASVKVCAKIHSYFWANSHPMSNLLTDPANPICLIVALKMKTNIKPMLKMCKEVTGFVPSDRLGRALSTSFPDGFYKLLLWCCESPFMTVCHGDARIDNLFFETLESGELEAGLFDWAQAMVAPCFYDISWALSNSFSIEFHDAHEEELLELYWESLLGGLGEKKSAVLSKEEFMQGYALSQVVSVSKCVIAYETIMKDKKAADFKHKQALVVNGMVNALKVMERHNAIDALAQVISGNTKSKSKGSNKVAPETSSQ